MNRMLAIAFGLLLVCTGMSSLLADVTPEKAAEHVGKYSKIQGTVAEVNFTEGTIYLNYGGKYPDNYFVALIPPASAKDFELPKLKELTGKVVKVTGMVQMYKGKPAIIVTKKSQITQ